MVVVIRGSSRMANTVEQRSVGPEAAKELRVCQRLTMMEAGVAARIRLADTMEAHSQSGQGYCLLRVEEGAGSCWNGGKGW